MQLSTKRLVLRDATLKDSGSLAAYQQDRRYLQYYSEAPDAKSIISSCLKWSTEHPRQNFQFVIALAENQRVIGCAGIRSKECPLGSAEIGIEIDPEFWGHGLAREAIAELISFAKLQKIDQLLASTHFENRKAHRLIENLGFSQVGRAGDQALFESQLS